ncbi:MAG: hypothetical protein COX32_01165 [Candidatus Moranbacteria bacterium CG23_combo_of_CG06-09_8_20_14_all_41_28]|nr:MAG: hypothetical protein COX32_01165 [Candidatus Moranbacteria bacterium CG23_combo_of_CG06-09_8_20_14_all_41_28]
MDYFSEYFKYVGDSEAPMIFHRWCALSTISSMIGREVFLPFGHKPIFPNQYTLLLGAPGTRKSSAIGIARTVLEKAGYKTFAKDRTSKERFFMDMARRTDFDGMDLEALMDLETLVLDAPSEVLVANGEFLDFIGQGNMDFLTALTNLWDNLDKYEHPKLHGKSVVIDRPTINILGGATVKGLGMAIPPEALGTGILSRLLMIHADMTEHKITFPAPVKEDAADQIVDTLQKIRTDLKGAITRTAGADAMLDRMYKTDPGVEDNRFSDYSARRFIHLLKLTILTALSEHRTSLTAGDALKANTVLHAAELGMPKALGEFGKSKYSDVANSIIDVLTKAHSPMSHSDLWKIVAKDLSDVKELGIIMKNLMTSDKVQVITVKNKQGYMPLHREQKKWDEALLLPEYLTPEERTF